MTEPTKRPLRVFLCHAKADKTNVQALYKRLVNDGVDAWLDEEKLLPGQHWQVEIPKAVRNSDVVIVCLSRESINKEGYVQREIKIALDTVEEKLDDTIFIIPARLEDCNVPGRLSIYQWVDLFSKGGYEKLLKALITRAIQINVLVPQKKGGSNLKTVSSPKIGPRTLGTLLALFLILCTATALIALGFWGIPKLAGLLNQAPTTNPTNVSSTNTPGGTSLVTPTNNLSVPPSTTASPNITDTKGVTMVLVLSGTFKMGSNNGGSDSKPVHEVYLSEFYIDKYEVTNAQYNKCVETGACQPPKSFAECQNLGLCDSNFNVNKDDRFENSQYANYPVVYVDWQMSNSYCEWRDGRLPTEAQWEKAARGTDERAYPWGDNINCAYANYFSGANGCVGDITEVGKYENGQSPYGAYDMSGNVWEWVSDWYDENYYAALSDTAMEPIGPDTGEYRGVRGGSWKNVDLERVSIALRGGYEPWYVKDDIGFRCIRLP